MVEVKQKHSYFEQLLSAQLTVWTPKKKKKYGVYGEVERLFTVTECLQFIMLLKKKELSQT